MVGSRTLTALAGIVASLVLSVAIYLYTGSLLFFLVVPFVPFLFSGGSDGRGVSHGTDGRERPPSKECPQCGFRTRDPGYDYCPRDGRRLQERDGRGY